MPIYTITVLDAVTQKIIAGAKLYGAYNQPGIPIPIVFITTSNAGGIATINLAGPIVFWACVASGYAYQSASGEPPSIITMQPTSPPTPWIMIGIAVAGGLLAIATISYLVRKRR